MKVHLMTIMKLFLFAIILNGLYAQPPYLEEPYPLVDPSDITIKYFPDDGDINAALGATPDYWDGEIREVYGVSVVGTVKSDYNYPSALDNAMVTVEFMMSALQSSSVSNAMDDHIIYIYHCDPTMKTGVNLQAKQDRYDYVSELINYEQSTHDGRAVDAVYGYGGSRYTPTTTCDCNVLGSACTQNAYHSSSILVHEFGHTIMGVGLRYGNPSAYQSIVGEIYDEYKPISNGEYCGTTPYEMWACSVETWLASKSTYHENPLIYTVDLIYEHLRPMYNLLYNTFGAPVSHLIPGLQNVQSLTNNQWDYFDFHINHYGDSSLKSHWNSIRYIGSPSATGTGTGTGSGTETTTTTTTTQQSGGSSQTGTLACGKTVSGYLTSGDTAYFYFKHGGGSVLMWPCGSDTTFATKVRVIDTQWNEKGSNTVSSYYSNGCSQGDSTYWASSDQLSAGGDYWLVVQGGDDYGSYQTNYGRYSVTMYCYGAANNVVELDLDANSNKASYRPGSVIALIVVAICLVVVVNILVIYFVVKYYTKKIEEYERKQTMIGKHKADDDGIYVVVETTN